METKTSGLYSSQFERQPQDFYKTPRWVTQNLIDTVPLRGFVLEPCGGDGALAAVLVDAGYKVAASDLMWRDGGPHPVIGGIDALAAPLPPGVQTVATNPPYGLLPQLIPHWLDQLEAVGGMLCLLLRAPYGESGRGQDLSTRHPTYAGRVRLPRRIQWFEGQEQIQGRSLLVLLGLEPRPHQAALRHQRRRPAAVQRLCGLRRAARAPAGRRQDLLGQMPGGAEQAAVRQGRTHRGRKRV